MSEQGFHGVKDENIEEIAHRCPEFGFRAQPFPQLTKQPRAALLDLVHQKSQQHEQRQDRGEMLLPVAIVMLEMIALVLERIEGFVLNLPAAASGTHHFFHGARTEPQIGDPGPLLDLAVWRGLLVEQKVNFDVDRALVQAQVIGPGEVMLHASLVSQAKLFDLPTGLAAGKLLKEALMRIGLDVQDVAPAIARDLPQVRGASVERVFDQ